VANPYPTGTCTLQDAPSFAWRANAELSGGFVESRLAVMMRKFQNLNPSGPIAAR